MNDSENMSESEGDRFADLLDKARNSLGQWRVDTVNRMEAGGVPRNKIVAAMLSVLAWELCVGAVIFGYRLEAIHGAIDEAMKDERLKQIIGEHGL
jgi:hypothetical protein